VPVAFSSWEPRTIMSVDAMEHAPQELTNGWRAVVCSAGYERADALAAALELAGYSTVMTSTSSDAAGRLAPHENAVVVLHGRHDDWLRPVADLSGSHPLAHPVLLADIENPEELLATVVAGVSGICRPDAEIEAIIRTIDAVRVSGVAIPRGFVAPLVEAVRHGRGHRVNADCGAVELTDREWEIMLLLLQRRSTREMADALYVSPGTIRGHVSTVLRKLGAVDREDAIAMIEHEDRLC